MKRNRSFNRSDRVAQQILEVLAGLILTEVKDPRVKDAQITAVDVTSDFQIAKIYYINLTDEGPNEEVQSGLERAAGFLRRALGERIQIRNTPELIFVYDESIERGRRIESLLSELDIPETNEK